jgi:hypothetical protein
MIDKFYVREIRQKGGQKVLSFYDSCQKNILQTLEDEALIAS